MTKRNWTSRDMALIRVKMKTCTYVELGNHFGLTGSAIKDRVKRWKQAGYIFPEKNYRKSVPVGTISTHIKDGRQARFVKTENGWQRITTRKNKKPATIKQKKALKKAMPVETRGRKKEFANRKIDLTDKVPVYIPERRMTIYVNKGCDVEAVRKKYLDHYEFMNKKAV